MSPRGFALIGASLLPSTELAWSIEQMIECTVDQFLRYNNFEAEVAENLKEYMLKAKYECISSDCLLGTKPTAWLCYVLVD